MTQVLTNQNGDQPTSDPLERCIIDLVSAMRSDYGAKFKSLFGDPEPLRQYKRRLYQKLKGINVQVVYEAYDQYVDNKNTWPPTVPDLLAEIEIVEREQKKVESNDQEIARLENMSSTATVKCDPLEMLAKAKAAAQGSSLSHDEWLKKKAAALQNHNAVLNIYSSSIKKPYIDGNHTCSYPNCHWPGTMSHGITGGGNYFCKEHFRA